MSVGFDEQKHAAAWREHWLRQHLRHPEKDTEQSGSLARRLHSQLYMRNIRTCCGKDDTARLAHKYSEDLLRHYEPSAYSMMQTFVAERVRQQRDAHDRLAAAEAAENEAQRRLETWRTEGTGLRSDSSSMHSIISSTPVYDPVLIGRQDGLAIVQPTRCKQERQADTADNEGPGPPLDRKEMCVEAEVGHALIAMAELMRNDPLEVERIVSLGYVGPRATRLATPMQRGAVANHARRLLSEK